MYHTGSHFVFTAPRDFVRNCETPVLIRPDDIPLPLLLETASINGRSNDKETAYTMVRRHHERAGIL
jgi:hypothetical protein